MWVISMVCYVHEWLSVVLFIQGHYCQGRRYYCVLINTMMTVWWECSVYIQCKFYFPEIIRLSWSEFHWKILGRDLSISCSIILIFCVCFKEQECFREELRRAQRKLLRISRDKRYSQFDVRVHNCRECTSPWQLLKLRHIVIFHTKFIL